MSFIDDLERAQEVSRADAIARAASLALARKESERLAKIAETEALRKRTPNDEDREFALLVREESGIGRLIQRLGEVLDHDERPSAVVARRLDEELWISKSHVTKPENVNSAVDSLIWGIESMGRGRSFASGCYDSAQYKYKNVEVECNPEGNILFHGSTRNLVLYQEWYVNRGELERAVEQAFRNPKIEKIERDKKLVCKYSSRDRYDQVYKTYNRQVWPGM